MAEAQSLADNLSTLELHNGTAAKPAAISFDDDEDGDEMIRPPTPRESMFAAPSPSLPVTIEGYLLKKCRQRGDDKPWKKRYFVLTQGKPFNLTYD
jgi:hypothetical protein